MASWVGGTGGLKKLKKDSAGRALRTNRVRFVSVDGIPSVDQEETRGYIGHTLISLLLNLELFCQILVLLPLDRRSNGTIVEEVTRIPNLFLIIISLLQLFVFKELVRGEDKSEFEARFGSGVGDTDVDKVLQSPSITIGDYIRGADMVPQRSQPKFWDRGSMRVISRKFLVGWVVLERLLLSCRDLVQCWLFGSRDDRETALVEWLIQVEILPKQAMISNSVTGQKGNAARGCDKQQGNETGLYG